MRAIIITHNAEEPEINKLKGYLKLNGIDKYLTYAGYFEFEKEYKKLDPEENFLYFPNIAIRYNSLPSLIKTISESDFDYIKFKDQILMFKTRELTIYNGNVGFTNKKKYFLDLSKKDNYIYSVNSSDYSIKYTGERLIPKLGNGNLQQHFQLYQQVIPFIYDKNIIDIACGSGWGSYLLAEYAESVRGVDISEEAVSYAKSSYKLPNLSYAQGDITAIPEKDKKFKVVVSIETFEHVPHDSIKKLIKESHRVLDNKGYFIFTTPDGAVFPYHPKDKSEERGYHLWHYTKDELEELLNPIYDHVSISKMNSQDNFFVVCYKK